MRNHKRSGRPKQVNDEANIGKIISKAQNVEKLDEKILQSVLAELANEFRKGKRSKVHFKFFHKRMAGDLRRNILTIH